MNDDEEPPVPFGTFRPSERRALIGCAFGAGCVLLMPQELVAAAISFVLAGGLGIWHLRRSKRERELEQTRELERAASAAIAKAEPVVIEPAPDRDDSAA